MSTHVCPVPGAFYRQSEEKLYQVRCLATEAESGEVLVICQALFDDFRLEAHKLPRFAKEFQPAEAPGAETAACICDTPGSVAESKSSFKERSEAETPAEEQSKVKPEQRQPIPEPAPEERDRLFLHFLELKSPSERRIFLEEERDNLSVRDIARIATALELEDSGEPEDQLRNAFAALRLQERYEKERGNRHV